MFLAINEARFGGQGQGTKKKAEDIVPGLCTKFLELKFIACGEGVPEVPVRQFRARGWKSGGLRLSVSDFQHCFPGHKGRMRMVPSEVKVMAASVALGATELDTSFSVTSSRNPTMIFPRSPTPLS